MGKYRYLAKNIGLLTLANFATKLLSFFLVPLYTNILTTEEYGTYDLFTTTIGVLLPILTLNIQDAVIRFSLDKNYKRNAIVSISTRYLILANLLVALGLLVNYIFGFSALAKQYAVYFFLMFLTQSVSGVVTAYIRGTDRIAILSVSSVIASAVTISLNILFLITFRWGLIGYFLANIIGPLVQSLYLAIRGHMFQHMHLRRRYSKQDKEMRDYSVPLIANTLSWWVNNASDKYVVIFFCGLAANGIYSVASKIPSILNVFQSIFSQAWSLSAVKDFDPEDKGGFFANTYAAYNCLMTVLCSLIIVMDKVLANFLYAKDFYVAWRYVPWLTMAIVFGALSGYLGGFFSALKDSKAFSRTTLVGAVTNVILNIIFTPIVGPLGAAIATTICYVEVWVYRLILSKKMVKMRINIKRDVVSYILLVVQSVLLLSITKNTLLYTLEISILFIVCILYFKDIKSIFSKLKTAMPGRK